VYSGATAGKARYNCYLAGREVFGRAFSFADIKSRRAPEFDGLTFWRGIRVELARADIVARNGGGPYNAILAAERPGVAQEGGA
jgi:hypothetical protein